MKNIVLICILICSSYVFLNAQQDPEAKKILDRVSAKNKNYTTIQTKFVLTIENRRENKKSSTSGFLKTKGPKYYMESFGTKVYYEWDNTLELY
jgi:outer membrane lipoprotein carrier protein